MAYTTKKGKDLWKSLWWAKGVATENAIEVVRGVILSLVESGKYEDNPYYLQVEQAAARAHDAYYEGRKWLYDFDAGFKVAPGKRYYAQTVEGKLFQTIFDFLEDPQSPFKPVPAKNQDWSYSFLIPVCDRDSAGWFFERAKDRIMKAPGVVYPTHYRDIKAQVLKVESQ